MFKLVTVKMKDGSKSKIFTNAKKAIKNDMFLFIVDEDGIIFPIPIEMISEIELSIGDETRKRVKTMLELG